MAFFMSTKGVLHPYNFRYLQGDFEKARIESTQVHGEERHEDVNKKVSFYAIDIMNKPVKSMDLHSSLDDIRSLMKADNIRHIPITDKNKFIGIISDRDLLKVDMSGTFPFLKANDIMNTIVIVADEETPLAHIARVLLEEKISALPIVDKKYHLTGIITRSDILKVIIYNQLVLK